MGFTPLHIQTKKKKKKKFCWEGDEEVTCEPINPDQACRAGDADQVTVVLLRHGRKERFIRLKQEQRL